MGCLPLSSAVMCCGGRTGRLRRGSGFDGRSPSSGPFPLYGRCQGVQHAAALDATRFWWGGAPFHSGAARTCCNATSVGPGWSAFRARGLGLGTGLPRSAMAWGLVVHGRSPQWRREGGSRTLPPPPPHSDSCCRDQWPEISIRDQAFCCFHLGAERLDQGCIGREGTSQAAPGAVRQAAGGACQIGWGRLLSVTNASEAGTCRHGDVAGRRLGALEGGGVSFFPHKRRMGIRRFTLARAGGGGGAPTPKIFLRGGGGRWGGWH